MLFSCPVKCEMSPFHPISGTSPFPLCVLEKTCWPGQAVLCGPRPGLVTNNRAKGLAPVSSSLRSDQKSFALIFFFFFLLTCLAADFSIPRTTGEVSNQETSPTSPRLSSQPIVLSYCFLFLGGGGLDLLQAESPSSVVLPFYILPPTFVS